MDPLLIPLIIWTVFCAIQAFCDDEEDGDK